MFMVGGAVRDMLMGQPPKDVDYVVVGATPEEMLAQGFKQVGADFPVFLDEFGTEYALARTERKSGRGYNGFVTDHNPEVTLEDDLMRRDLSINAMAIAADETVVDPFNGQQDLKDKVLRHVSEAFADDPVRVLRLARFHARYGDEWTVHPETLAFCKQMVASGELAFLTRERILKELEKALSEESPELFFETLADCEALSVVFPEIDKERAMIAMDMFPSRSAKFNYAKLSSTFADAYVFESRLNVSVEWIKFARMFRSASSAFDMHPVDRLYRMDAYRQYDLWEDVVEECDKAGCPLSLLSEAYELTKHINFASLPESVVSKLEAKEFGKAIADARKAAFEARP